MVAGLAEPMSWYGVPIRCVILGCGFLGAQVWVQILFVNISGEDKCF